MKNMLPMKITLFMYLLPIKNTFKITFFHRFLYATNHGFSYRIQWATRICFTAMLNSQRLNHHYYLAMIVFFW